MEVFKGKITDLKDNKARVLFKTMDSSVSGWINIPQITASINSNNNCLIKPTYLINDTVIVLTYNDNLNDGIILCKE